MGKPSRKRHDAEMKNAKWSIPNWMNPGMFLGAGMFRALRPAARGRAAHREPKWVQAAKIATAGEKRMRRRERPQGSAS